jgi:hypothetical protein
MSVLIAEARRVCRLGGSFFSAQAEPRPLRVWQECERRSGTLDARDSAALALHREPGHGMAQESARSNRNLRSAATGLRVALRVLGALDLIAGA